MQDLKFNLSNQEYEEFKDLLFICSDYEMPLINKGIAEIVLKRIEDEE